MELFDKQNDYFENYQIDSVWMKMKNFVIMLKTKFTDINDSDSRIVMTRKNRRQMMNC
jgi:hypothetical protein